MLPTLNGRLQTRVFATLVIGSLWSIVLALFVPGLPEVSWADKVKAEIGLLLVLTVLGLGWELVYHGLMQFRWEKDWPTLFGLVTLVNEGLLVHYVAVTHTVDVGWAGRASGLPRSTFLVAFLTTWLVVWLWVNGPMRVFTVHWRFNGGRLL